MGKRKIDRRKKLNDYIHWERAILIVLGGGLLATLNIGPSHPYFYFFVAAGLIVIPGLWAFIDDELHERRRTAAEEQLVPPVAVEAVLDASIALLAAEVQHRVTEKGEPLIGTLHLYPDFLEFRPPAADPLVIPLAGTWRVFKGSHTVKVDSESASHFFDFRSDDPRVAEWHVAFNRLKV